MKLPAINPGDLVGGGHGYLDMPGWYHFLVDNVKEGLSIKDEPTNGTTVELTCLNGSVPDCADKKCNITLWDIDQSKSADEQKQTVNRLWNFFLATNVVTPEQMKTDIEIDCLKAVGAQVCIHLARKQKKTVDNGKVKWVDDMEAKFLQVAYSDIYHVDDPLAAKCPKSVEAVGLIPQELRHDADWFSFRDDSPSLSGASAGKSSDYSEDDDF